MILSLSRGGPAVRKWPFSGAGVLWRGCLRTKGLTVKSVTGCASAVWCRIVRGCRCRGGMCARAWRGPSALPFHRLQEHPQPFPLLPAVAPRQREPLGGELGRRPLPLVLGALGGIGLGPERVGLGEALVDLLLALGEAVAVEGAPGVQRAHLAGKLAQRREVGEEGGSGGVLGALPGGAGLGGLELDAAAPTAGCARAARRSARRRQSAPRASQRRSPSRRPGGARSRKTPGEDWAPKIREVTGPLSATPTPAPRTPRMLGGTARPV